MIVNPVVASNPPPPTERPPAKVEVAVPWTMRVEVAMRPCMVVVPAMKALPWTAKSCAGVVVPTPTSVPLSERTPVPRFVPLVHRATRFVVPDPATVVVEVHEGMPFVTVRIWPVDPMPNFERVAPEIP